MSLNCKEGRHSANTKPRPTGRTERRRTIMRVFTGLAVAAAIFVGLLSATPAGAIPVANDVEIELYHVFPIDSDTTRTPNVITRVNSPSDNNFAAADGALGQLTFTTTVLNPSFTAANSVVNGIRSAPNQFTGGEGAVTGTEVEIDVKFTTPLVLGAD